MWNIFSMATNSTHPSNPTNVLAVTLNLLFVVPSSAVDFTNISRAAFTLKIPKEQKDTGDLTVFLPFWDLRE